LLKKLIIKKSAAKLHRAICLRKIKSANAGKIPDKTPEKEVENKKADSDSISRVLYFAKSETFVIYLRTMLPLP